MTVEEMLTDYAKRGYSRAMVMRELGWSRYKFYSIVEDYPDIPWKPFHQTLEFKRGRDNMDSPPVNSREFMIYMRSCREAAKYSVLGMEGTVPELVEKLGTLCSVSVSTVRKRLLRGFTPEEAFLAPYHKGNKRYARGVVNGGHQAV